MSRRTGMRLLSLALLLGVTGALGTQASPPAEASTCCEFCFPEYQACTAHPAACDWRYESCLATCSSC